MTVTATPATQLSVEAVYDALHLFIEPGTVTELRALHVRAGGYRRSVTIAGFFHYDALEVMAKEAVRLTTISRGVYFTLNPLKPELLARCCNRVDEAESGSLASDKDVLRRRWLLVDTDPKRPTGISATDAEKAGALETTRAIWKYLHDLGWPASIAADSGNGYHQFYRIDLPADDERVVERILKVLANKFDSATVEVDKSVFNPARICKIPGTLARKGDDVADRPHRPGRLLEVPEVMTPVSAEPLNDLAWQWSELAKPAKTTTSSNGNGTYECKLLVEKWLRSKSIAYRVKKDADKKGRTVYVLARCPFDGSHADPDSCIMQDTDGELSAKCFHNSCDGKGWKEFKAKIGVPANDDYDPPLTGGGKKVEAKQTPRKNPELAKILLDRAHDCRHHGFNVEETVADVRKHNADFGTPPLPDAEVNRIAGIPWQYGDASEEPELNGVHVGEEERIILRASEVLTRKIQWLWESRIPLGKLVTFAGVGGLGKTFVLCDIAARLTTGTAWPDGSANTLTGQVIFISGEDDLEDTIVPRLIECGADLERIVFLTTKAQTKFTLADLPTLEKALQQAGGVVRLVVIDPPTAYLNGVDDHKNAELRGLLTPLKEWAGRHRVAIIFNTHVNKASGKVEAMMRVMGSVAWVNAVRAAHLFAKDPDDPDRRLFIGMKLNVGKEKKGLAYRIVPTHDDLAKVEWLGEVDTTADEAAAREPKKPRAIVGAEWLAGKFAEKREWASDDLFAAAREEGVSRHAVFEAKERLSLPKARKTTGMDGNTCWTWWVPEGWVSPLTATPTHVVPEQTDIEF